MVYLHINVPISNSTSISQTHKMFLVLSGIHHIFIYFFYILHEIFFHPKIHNLPRDKVRCVYTHSHKKKKKRKLCHKSKLVPVCINHCGAENVSQIVYIFIIPSMIFVRRDIQQKKRLHFYSNFFFASLIPFPFILNLTRKIVKSFTI